ncbi:hypothetical protein PsYK624_034010 [Phanerochaete sordida]|uniref:Cytochrome P450 n=1 Tax=Phanerochaete sordida TaxID=48140 RepID=A0A9P3G1J8_9APHY|nr:hypothetical protein PsYK624_034010 [Phanerochaete sordida]
MIVHGDTSGFVKQAQLSMAMFDVFTELRWALEILEWFPAIARNPLVPQFAYCKKMMHDRAEHDCGSDHEDFASYWLQERTRSQRHPALTPDDMTLEALLAMQAGLDTVGATFVHMIYFVLSNPAIGERLKEELERNLSDQNTSMDIDSLMQLPYLSAIVEESFRLGSPWHSVPRQVAGQATVIDGFAVPPNTVVAICTGALASGRIGTG